MEPKINLKAMQQSLSHAVALLGEFLTPISVIAFALAVWCLGADLRWTNEFPLRGVISRWMVWTGIGGTLSFLSSTVHRTRRPA
jgi:hypothetical protein